MATCALLILLPIPRASFLRRGLAFLLSLMRFTAGAKAADATIASMVVSDLVQTLLAKRGITDIETFLNPSYDDHLHDPLLLSDMDKALERFFLALEREERIALYCDYDCDGLASATVLTDFLRRIGYGNFEVYLPHRDKEGYGFHAAAVRALSQRGTSLIVTADVGISGQEGVEAAGACGADVIVTDHHEPMVGIPPALAVVNPKLGSYPFAHLCGAAVAWKFVQAALAEGRRLQLPQFLSIADGWEKWLLDVVAIATIADMVPLVGENRVLVHYGLRVLRRSRRAGLRALAEVSRLRLSAATEDDIGFSLAPRLNAASRMDSPELALSLLTTGDGAEAARLAQALEALNRKRKGVVAAIVREAKKRARERFTEAQLVTVLGDASWKPSLLGLAANSVMAERRGVVCLWGRDATGALKGSCRSDGIVSLSDLFARAADAFEQYGGHAHAGGFTVSQEAVYTLHERLEEAARSLRSDASALVIREHLPAQTGDASVPLAAISDLLMRDISLLSPFGVGNPKPLFHIPESRVIDVRRFGKEKNHTEVTLECPATGRRLRAFDFFKEPAAFTLPPSPNAQARVLGTIERDSFRGAGAVALRVVDFLPLC